MKTPNPIDKHVGARIRMRRMMLNMSQEKLGDALGLTFQQVQKYEKGTNRVGGSRMHTIAGILKVPVSFFYEGLPQENGIDTGASDEARNFFASRDGVRLMTAWPRLQPKLRHAFLETIEVAAGKA